MASTAMPDGPIVKPGSADPETPLPPLWDPDYPTSPEHGAGPAPTPADLLDAYDGRDYDRGHAIWELPVEHLPIEQSHRHSWWASRRSRTYAALYTMGVSSRRLINFEHCGSNASVMVEQKTGAIRVQACKCHDRFCQACGEERGALLADSLQKLCARGKTLHVVLTLCSTDDDLRTCLDRIYQHFRSLRADKWWKLHVTGGSVSFECTWNAVTRQWHPHLHVLCHADYLDQRTLRGVWYGITGDSHVCNVSLVGKGIAAAREVTKYISKPIHRSVDGDQDLIIGLMRALKGRRLITTFGTWRGTRLHERPAPDPLATWLPACSLIRLYRQAALGDLWSQQALRYLVSRRPGRVHVPLPTAIYPKLTAPPPALPAG